MSKLKRILMLAVCSLFIISIFAGCVASAKERKYDTKWDPAKMQYVLVK